MTSHDLYVLLNLLAKLDVEVAGDTPSHLAVTILKIQVEKKLGKRKELG